MTRDFRAYWSAEVTSVFGSMFTLTAIGIVAVETFDATPGQIGVITAAATVPVILFGLASGAVADRARRPRRLLIACDAAGALAVLTVAFGLWSGRATLWWLVALSFVLGTVATVVSPVYFTHLSCVLGAGTATAGERSTALVRGRARLQSGQYGARIGGRAAAGPVIAWLGAASGFLVDAVSYVVSLVLLLSLRAPDVGAPRPADEPARGGWSALRANRFLAALVWFLVVLSAVLGAITTLTTPFLLRTLDVPVALYGLVLGSTGVAGLLGSLVATRLVGRVSNAALALAGFGGAAASLLILPAAGGPLAVGATVAGLGVATPVLFGAVSNIGLVGIVTTTVPEHVMGRAVATMTTITTVAQLVGAVGGGVLGDAVGERAALWCCAGVAIAGLIFVVPAARATGDPAAPSPHRVLAERG